MTSNRYVVPGPWPGELAIIARPRGGDWLADEIAGWKTAGLEVIVSALTPDEVDSMDLAMEEAEGTRQGLEVIVFPIPDRGTPASFAGLGKLISGLSKLLDTGKHVGIHCRQGIGRSAVLAAALLMKAGIEPNEAWQRIENARGCPVPDTAEQKAWVERFARSKAVSAVDI